ncbi:hypothetical protein M885DRAFT_466628 [Pelagophyceae sp. CCMP2097]|nr:hypothetical protein M885DRAFT_466628 [Pelagophyceae sp. CCMP2097]
MVEGHSVHRVASGHRKALVGKKFAATSPNGRFATGAALIDGAVFQSIEAHGKNLFAFFDAKGVEHVVHVHFGMAGNWAVFDTKKEPEPPTTATTRLRLQAGTVVAHLSAMTVDHGNRVNLYDRKRSKLGEDPLRDDADSVKLWQRVSVSKKSIGALIMDQSYFCGPGNIYRAEILFKAGVHPDQPGLTLSKAQFDLVWLHTVSLLKRGYATGSILTVDDAEKASLKRPDLRRYIYNQAKCPRCETRIVSWQINARTAYACPNCQPLHKADAAAAKAVKTVKAVEKKPSEPFLSHCARESTAERLQQGAAKLTVAELRAELKRRGEATTGLKAVLALRLDALDAAAAYLDELDAADALLNAADAPPDVDAPQTLKAPLTLGAPPQTLEAPLFTSALDAAREKVSAAESRAVEHVADLHPAQAKRAREHLTPPPKRKRRSSADAAM